MAPITKKRSFFERLTGSVRVEDDEPVVLSSKKTPLRRRFDDYEEESEDDEILEVIPKEESREENSEEGEDPAEAQLAVDVYETNTEIVIKTMTAGVKKEDLHITISRESIIIRGKRDNEPRAYQYHYHDQELYWGAFSREIALPDEIDIDQAAANEYHGLITIKLPKFDKKRKATLKIQ